MLSALLMTRRTFRLCHCRSLLQGYALRILLRQHMRMDTRDQTPDTPFGVSQTQECLLRQQEAHTTMTSQNRDHSRKPWSRSRFIPSRGTSQVGTRQEFPDHLKKVH